MAFVQAFRLLRLRGRWKEAGYTVNCEAPEEEVRSRCFEGDANFHPDLPFKHSLKLQPQRLDIKNIR